jgi:lipoate-protein ligase A
MQPEVMNAIKQLAEKKYKTWEWNFGYSPDYSFLVLIPVQSEIIQMNINVRNGRFDRIEFPVVNRNSELIATLINMTGLMHKEEEIDHFVENNRNSLELAGINIVKFAAAFFE